MSNPSLITKLIRPELLKLKAYSATPNVAQFSKRLEIPESKIIKLNSAENSSVQSFYPKQLKSNYYAYPDPMCIKLRQKVGQYVGFSPKWVACGNGSDELIDILIALFVGQGEEVLLCPPTFPMYEYFCQVRGVKIKIVDRDRKLKINVQKVKNNIGSKTKLVFIDSPGNPTGVVISPKDLELLLKEDIVVVVDEAYFEYSGKTCAGLVKKYSNLIILRTFSKWAGLAGLRVGYMIANPKVIQMFFNIKPPYNVNSAAQEAAILALERKQKLLKKLKQLLMVKKWAVTELSNIEQLNVWPGQGAYIALEVKTGNRQRIVNQLKSQGIIVKQINQNRMENYFLLSLESKLKMRRFISSFKNIIKK